MFYLSRVQIEDVIETIRAKDPIKMCADNTSTLVLIRVLGMPVTCNMEWRSCNLLIACNTGTVSLTLCFPLAVLPWQ